MTVLERRVHMATAILNDLDDKDFSEMERFFKDLKKRQRPEPCMYTIEEIKTKLPAIIKELEEGKGIPHEAIKRKAIS